MKKSIQFTYDDVQKSTRVNDTIEDCINIAKTLFPELKSKTIVLYHDNKPINPTKNVPSRVEIRIPIIVLDIDETLIHSVTKEDYIQNKDLLSKFPAFVMDDEDDEENPYIVVVRPKLIQFLKFLTTNFDTMIWTAASRDYAVWIIKNVFQKFIPDFTSKLKLFLHGDHCDVSWTLYDKHKHLPTLQTEFNLKNIDNCFKGGCYILIDDSDEARNSNSGIDIHYGYQIEPFELETDQLKETDRELVKLQKHLQNIQKFMFKNLVKTD